MKNPHKRVTVPKALATNEFVFDDTANAETIYGVTIWENPKTGDFEVTGDPEDLEPFIDDLVEGDVEKTDSIMSTMRDPT